MKICLIGATGRLGKEIIQACREHAFEVVYGVVSNQSLNLSQEVSGVTTLVSASHSGFTEKFDVVIDASSPVGARTALEIALKYQRPLLVCTTGLDRSLTSEIESAGTKIPVMICSNTSVGMNTLFELSRQATKLLGPGFDVEIVELHHRGKKDVPSGSALSIAQKIHEERDLNITARAHGQHDSRPENELVIHGLRGGDFPAEHQVYFLGKGERLELTHRVWSRSIYAHGALSIAQWLSQQKAQKYAISDYFSANS
ncbi:4-hydroxy-tetrahydrodipicolinate reductase [bacterium]|nr:4-hydroxy-tetrahydrodipicolinate reductase [bacterium]